ncbi:hypothetical protein ASPWEDRAFT_34217 [Aspergillus wentii DTO 134E9]|uniref:Pentatricopeptide repeat domain-containing protein n=1 Tax=Aspergillus wentii DTO 134E9 TaxID=1073089 RepID=A0A1L9S0R9_ASPWE|nr:uncharacterized protein ASPWEDRAFT_34217 [Aspergillus wentii DTO 134E9]KAI9931237.1 hypothetical protein MW887_010899 [Aspergillus wentii]OJJ40754.1 hypothetical protein ASPWEDRAFT_34217 [Aspergillus wentii DTO 134E9]
MRPALLRLLKRPSAVSVLDSLISTPVGIEHLESRYECLRCSSRKIHQNAVIKEIEPELPARRKPACQPQAPADRSFSFRVHDIDSSPNNATDNKTRTRKSSRTRTTAVAGNLADGLGLQPEKLEFESDVGHTNDFGTRLVDHPLHQYDFALWEELLRYRQRHYGDKGTLDIWEGLSVRVDSVQFPVHGEGADLFWRSFVSVGLKREVFMEELAAHALDIWKQTGKRWDKFYESVVGGYLERGMVQQAVEWHKKLQHPHLAHANDILRILEPAASLPFHRIVNSAVLAKEKRRPDMSPGVRAFQHICQTVEGHQIYGSVISTLLQHGNADDALSMHLFLVERNDHPHTYEDMQPLFEYVKEYEPWYYFKELRKYSKHRFGIQTNPSDLDTMTTKTQPSVNAESWPEEKPFKDEFGARLFATNAFNFEMILAGLKMFGVPAIGPQSLREMAARADGAQDILDKLQMLQKAGIASGNTVFARLIRKLATENREILLSDLLRSDQHPEVLEDASMQESLLVSHYLTRDWRQYNMTLAILAELSEEGPQLFNIHFRKHIAAGEWIFATKVVDQMALQGKTLTKDSVDFMVEHALTPRRRGIGPVTGPGLNPIAEVTFVFRVLQRVVPMGIIVPSEIWVELLKRLGMTNHWDELRECCLWLVRHYSSSANQARVPWTVSSSKDRSRAEKNALSRPRGSRVLDSIFPPWMQGAIVAWGFKMRVSPKLDKVYNHPEVAGENLVIWVRGLVLLREMEKNGLHLSEERIRWSCRLRLATLFSRPRLSSRIQNRMLRRENPYDVRRVINDIVRVWGEPSLFQGEEDTDQYGLVNPRWSASSVQRYQRMLSELANIRRVKYRNRRRVL